MAMRARRLEHPEARNERLRLLLALIFPLAAVVLQGLLWELARPHAWLLLYPAVFVSAWIGGKRAGILSTALSCALGWWLFVDDPRRLVPVAVFLVAGAALSVLLDSARRARDKAEERERRLQREILRLERELGEHASPSLVQNEQLEREWASAAAHDLQQPLNSILLRCDLLLRSELAERQRADVSRVRASAERLSQMVNDLADIAKLESRRLELARERLDIGELVREVIERAPDSGARARAPDDRRLFVRGDPARLGQVLTNLVHGAARYGGDKKQIVVEVEDDAGDVRVSVKNPAAALEGDQLARVFERSRSDDTPSEVRLGLVLAKDLVEAHGGRIWAEHVPGDGTAFRFSVPLDGPPTPRSEGTPR